MIKEIIRVVVYLLFGFNATFVGDVTDRMDELGINYEMVDTIAQAPRAMAYYEFDTGTIYFSKRAVGNAGGMLRYFAAHEIIHSVRYEAGLWGDLRIEEAISCYGAARASKLLGFGGISIKTWPSFRNSLKANGLEVLYPSDEEKELIEKEILKTLEIIKQRLTEKVENN